MRIVEQCIVTIGARLVLRLTNHPHLRTRLDRGVLRFGAAAIGNQYGDERLAAVGPVERRHERREEWRLRDLARFARRDIGNVDVGRIVEVREIRDLATIR